MSTQPTRALSIKERIVEEKDLVIAGLPAKSLLVSQGEREPKLIYFRPPFETMEIDGRPNMLFHTDLDSVVPDREIPGLPGVSITREVANKKCEEAFLNYWKPTSV